MQSIYQVQSEKYVTVDALDKRYEIQVMLSFDFFLLAAVLPPTREYAF